MSVENISYPPKAADALDDKAQHVLIYFIPGNPGLIGYYKPFLSALRDLLDSNASLGGVAFHIFGQNLLGFSDEDHDPPFSSRHNKPYDLEQQIEHTLRGLSTQVRSVPNSSDDTTARSFDKVLLIGHSVGAFIALEACHRVLLDPTLSPDLNAKLGSGILLFPTIDHIADSPSGQKLDLLRRVPVLGPNAYRIARGFLRLWPYGWLHAFVSRVLGFPSHAAEVTTRWLKSRDGVWQSLYLGMDEMRLIREDKWSDDLWEIQKSQDTHTKSPPRFYFFFGKNDHWVADHYRDQFIKKRAEKSAGDGNGNTTRVIIDESKIPHAFCIQHSEAVAQKVHDWINDMFT
ncbi:hypothetical protein F5Y17DRAFT_434853 [Xylariaceae sp. FL0594]|nr:hypothetical protein F5Y17DRAFT_434853 [Xylariaceae sp. FL0594]